MIAVELRKLVLRPRVWLSILLLCAVPALVAILLSISDLAPPPGQGGAFLSAVTSNGSLYPAAALAMVLPVFLPLAVAVYAGDAIAGESATGTLRYLLVRPVGRLRLLAAKLSALAVYIVLAMIIVVVFSLVIGIALFGVGAEAVGQPGSVTSLSGRVAGPVGAGGADARGGRLHRGVDARLRHHCPVLVDAVGLGAGRGPGLAGGADRELDHADAGRGRPRSSRTCRRTTG